MCSQQWMARQGESYEDFWKFLLYFVSECIDSSIEQVMMQVKNRESLNQISCFTENV